MQFKPSERARDPTTFLSNWVIMTLPFIEQEVLYDSFDFSDSISLDVNRGSRGTILPTLLYPTDKGSRERFNGDSPVNDHWARGNYAANAGDGTLSGNQFWDVAGSDLPSWQSDQIHDVMGANTSVKFRDITDGTTNTIMLGEVRIGFNDKERRGT